MRLTYLVNVSRVSLALVAAVLCGFIVGTIAYGNHPPLLIVLPLLVILTVVIQIAIDPQIVRDGAPTVDAIYHDIATSPTVVKPALLDLSRFLPSLKGPSPDMNAQSIVLAVEDVVKKDATVLEAALASLGVKLEDLYAEAVPFFQEEVAAAESTVGPLIAEIVKSKPLVVLEAYVQKLGSEAEATIFGWWLQSKLKSLSAAPVVAPAIVEPTPDEAAAAIAGALGHT